MIQPSEVFLALDPVDMRWGIDRLSQLVQHSLGAQPTDGRAYGFSNRSRSRLKLLLWDGTGVWLCQRRLHRGHFRWPEAGDALFRMTAQQWQWLTLGVEWQRLEAQPQARWQV